FVREGDREASGPLAAFLEDLTLSREGPDAEGRERVGLMTIHQSKGLEFDCVVVAGLEDQLLPFRSFAGGRSSTDIEEERRLFYVAMTRARERLHLTWARTRRIYGKTQSFGPSPFLRDIPGELSAGDRPEFVRAPSAPSSAGRPSGQFREGGSGFSPSFGRPFRRERSASPAVEGPASRGASGLEKRPGESSPAEGTAPISGGIRKEWIGKKVRHPRFGEGVVLDARRPDPDLELVVRFSEGPPRTLLARLANLTPADGEGRAPNGEG
ncbi:MAG: hypothetical protein M1509_00035, partial [Nitrospirae bacterium]|nr:hypothetical protein [Nitrospirota bacterium]